MKTLVAYFSAESGATASIARSLASSINADLFEIKPETPYSKADLNYMNPLARCNREHFGKKSVPVINKVESFEQYDAVLICFPRLLLLQRLVEAPLASLSQSFSPMSKELLFWMPS